MTTATQGQFRVGQRVQVHGTGDARWDGKLATVVKVNPVNIKVEVDGGRLLNAARVFLRDASDGAPAAPATPYAVALEQLPPCVGTLVKCKGEGKMPAGLYVVIGEGQRRGYTVVKLAKLGGESGRYWTTPLANIETVTEFHVELP